MGAEQATDLEGFHAGDRHVLEQIYRRHVGRVERAVSRYCRGVDAECVVHEVFLSLIERAEVRRQFTGGDLGGWLATIGARRAVDYLRKSKRMTAIDDPRSLEGKLEPIDEEAQLLQEDQARHLRAALDRFQAEHLEGLGPKLAQVFSLRFCEQLSQSEAARRLGIPRTTLIEREGRLLKRLGRFLQRELGEALP
jgi:RNA polymerase sigma factor (sigma-70 family)